MSVVSIILVIIVAFFAVVVGVNLSKSRTMFSTDERVKLFEDSLTPDLKPYVKVLSYDGLPNVVNAEVLAAGERLGYRARMSDVTTRGSSDHQSFHAKDVPVLFAFTGIHSDYHRPSDTADKINYEDLDRIVAAVNAIAGAGA